MNDTAVIDLVPGVPDTVPPHGGEAMRKWVQGINGWTAWMQAAGRSPATIATRRYQIGRLAEARLRRSPWRLSTTDLAGWLGSHDWDPATLSTYRSAVCSFYKWARIAGHVRHDPSVDLPSVSVPSGQPRPAPEAVLETALAAADDRDRMILLLGGYAGLRRVEIAGLRWEHLTDTGRLRIRGKGRKVRTVPTHPVLVAELGAERGRRDAGTPGLGYRYSAGTDTDGGWMFPGRLGGHLTPEVVGRTAAKALGDGWTAHTLRHRFATGSLAYEGNLRSVQTLLGHASPATTAVYTAVADDTLTATVNAL